eukprot:scaffold115_cov304-Prasinococcus_capsulatus_cf.AAC.14
MLPSENTKYNQHVTKKTKIERYSFPIGAKKGKGAAQPPAGAGYNATFWNEFARSYGNEVLKSAWLDKFDVTLNERGAWKAGRINKNDLFFRMEMNRDQAGFEIGPHTDQSRKWVRVGCVCLELVALPPSLSLSLSPSLSLSRLGNALLQVTVLFYLPQDDAYRELGTCVLHSKSGKTQRESEKEKFSNPDFTVTEQAPFVRNAVFSFAPCLTSWHGVKKLDGQATRNSIQGFISTMRHQAKGHCPQ